MPLVEFVKDYRVWQKGERVEISDNEWDMFRKMTDSKLYKVVKDAGKGHESEQVDEEDPNVREVFMGDVHTRGGLIMEEDKTYQITLLNHAIREHHNVSEDGKREWNRYEVNILYEDKETTTYLPPTVIETMWRAINKNDAVPVTDKRPRFGISYTGEGKKRKWSVMFLGVTTS